MKKINYSFLLLASAFLISCGEEEPEVDNRSIDGEWKTALGNILEIDGDEAFWISYDNVSVYVEAAIEQGHMTLDTPPLKNYKNVNGKRTGEAFRFSYTEYFDTGEIEITHSEWVEVEITLSDDGNTLEFLGVHPETFPESLAGVPFEFAWTRN